MFIYLPLSPLSEDKMTERPQIETTAPLVPEMPKNRVRTDGGRAAPKHSGNELVDEADAPLVPDLS
jgi:hypothetical protein